MKSRKEIPFRRSIDEMMTSFKAWFSVADWNSAVTKPSYHRNLASLVMSDVVELTSFVVDAVVNRHAVVLRNPSLQGEVNAEVGTAFVDFLASHQLRRSSTHSGAKNLVSSSSTSLAS